MEGWIKLHREIINNPIFANDGLYKFFTYCIMRANYKDTEIYLGHELIPLERGQFVSGQHSLSKDLKCSRAKIRLFEKTLTKGDFIAIKTTNKYSIITVINYDKYQSDDEKITSKTTNGTPTDSQRIATDKNNKKEKKEIKETILQEETLKEVKPVKEQSLPLTGKSLNYYKILEDFKQRYSVATGKVYRGLDKMDMKILKEIGEGGIPFEEVFDKYFYWYTSNKWFKENPDKVPTVNQIRKNFTTIMASEVRTPEQQEKDYNKYLEEMR